MKRAVFLGLFLVMITATMSASVHGQTLAPSWSEPTADRPALDVPYVPTPTEVVAEMLNLAAVKNSDVLYDLGCGDGRIVVTAAKERKVRKAVGFDLDPKRIRESRENARLAGVTEQVSFEQKNLFDVDLSEATVLSLYLLPTVNLQLRPKLFRELKPGTRIVSHDFDMDDWQPDRTVQLGPHNVYYWMVPANAGGTWTWSLAEGARTRRYELRLKQRFQKVEQAELLVDGKDRPVTDIRVIGDSLEFLSEDVMDGRKRSLRFKGKVQANSLSGSVGTVGRAGGDRTWSAERDEATVMPLDRPEQKQIRL